jgi:hypothetical protein
LLLLPLLPGPFLVPAAEEEAPEPDDDDDDVARVTRWVSRFSPCENMVERVVMNFLPPTLRRTICSCCTRNSAPNSPEECDADASFEVLLPTPITPIDTVPEDGGDVDAPKIILSLLRMRVIVVGLPWGRRAVPEAEEEGDDAELDGVGNVADVDDSVSWAVGPVEPIEPE